MRYGGRLIEGTFIERPNRFLAIVRFKRRKRECFVPDPGRLEELLVPGATVFVKEGSGAEERRTKWDLILVKKGRTLVCIDTRMPNKLVPEAMEGKAIKELKGFKLQKAEYTFLNSRFDFLLKSRKYEMLLEAKSCNLVEDGVALFPDAPTERGARHMKTLADGIRRGMKASVVFVVQRGDAKEFRPHDRMDPEFGLSLRVAMAKGVKAFAYKCKVSKTSIRIDGRIPIRL